jgi:hypothetical protein
MMTNSVALDAHKRGGTGNGPPQTGECMQPCHKAVTKTTLLDMWEGWPRPALRQLRG